MTVAADGHAIFTFDPFTLGMHDGVGSGKGIGIGPQHGLSGGVSKNT